MKLFNRSLFIWLSFTTICFAQMDSITTQNYNLRALLWSQFINTPSIHQNLPIADFTETSIYTTLKNQPLSKAQTPNKVNYYGFNSKGIFSLKNNLKLFGNLDFYRSYSKETSYLLLHNLSEEYTTELLPSVNYPLAIREGNNENLHYKLKGGISGKITKKIPFSVSINYNLDKFYGLTIPKTEQEVIEYNGNIELGYQFKKHTLFGFLSLEKQQNNFSFNLENINSTPINVISVPKSYAGYSVGYGDILGYNSILLAGLLENNTQKFGTGYNYRFKNHFLTLKYTRKENKEHYYATAYRDETNLAGLLTRNQNTLALSYINNYKAKYLIIDGSFITGKATNIHAFENYVENSNGLTLKNNYQHQLTKGTLNTTWQKKQHGIVAWSTSFNNSIQQNTIEDYNTTQKKVTSWNTSINLNKDFRLNKASFINIETGIRYYTPINTTLNYTSQNSSTSSGASLIPPSNTFGSDVITHDYLYDTLQKGGSIFNIRYQQQLPKNKNLILAFNYSFLTALTSNSATESNNNFGLRLNLQY